MLKKETPGLIRSLLLICSSWFSRHIWCTRSGMVAWPIHLSQGGLLWPASSRLDHVSNIIETPQERNDDAVDDSVHHWPSTQSVDIYTMITLPLPAPFLIMIIIINFLWYHWKPLRRPEFSSRPILRLFFRPKFPTETFKIITKVSIPKSLETWCHTLNLLSAVQILRGLSYHFTFWELV